MSLITNMNILAWVHQHETLTLVLLWSIVVFFGVRFVMSIFTRHIKRMITTAIGTTITVSIMSYISNWIK